HLLKTHKRPVLYLNADREIVAQPALLSELVRDRIDFAIYNWLADEYNDRFYPVNSNPGYYRYNGCVGAYSTTQLIASGPTQLYANSVRHAASCADGIARWSR